MLEITELQANGTLFDLQPFRCSGEGLGFTGCLLQVHHPYSLFDAIRV